MKKILLPLSFLFCITQQIFSQACTVTASAPKDTIVCGDRILLSAYGKAQGIALLSENFNNGNYGPGWQSTQQAMWNSPCGVGPDGTIHIWMGNSSPVPRILTTASFNLSSCANAGVTICFDMKFATQGNNSPCEGPDEPQEGVYLQYSINNGATWVDIKYFDPNGGNDPQLINWNNWCFPVPAAALTANTKFRWFQDADSGADYDHWGLDNVVIYCNDPSYNIVWPHDGYNAGPTGGVDPTPVAPRTTTSYVVTMSNGTTTCRDTVTVVVRNPTIQVNAGNDTVVCTGQCARLNGTAKVIRIPGGTKKFRTTEPDTITSIGGAFSPALVDINVRNLNMTTVSQGSIVSVCIDSASAQDTYLPGFPPFIPPTLLVDMNMGDFKFELVCPGGNAITLVPADTNILGNDYTRTCFVPNGSGPLVNGAQPYSGNYTPVDPFTNLNSCTANGVWSLRATSSFGMGIIKGWSITFNDPDDFYTGNFNWSPTTNMTGSNTLTPTVCPPPTAYTLTVSDTAGCVTQSDVVNVTTQTCCTLSATATRVQPTCGQSNGSINITPVPAGSYTYAWSDGPATTQNRTGLAAGTYTVTITSTSTPTCTFDTTIILNSNSSLTFNFSNQVNPTCAGAGNNGSITATLAGGTAPYTITVDTNGTPQSSVSPIAGSLPITGLHGGNIVVTVTDAAGCTAGATATLVAPVCCSLSATTAVTQPTCGPANGAINVTPTPAGSYTYAWSDGPTTTQNRTGLAAGTYTVTITTVGNPTCTFTTSATLNAPNCCSLSATSSTTQPTCGQSNGAINITPSPAGNYTYAWSDGPVTTQNRTALAAGAYTVTITTVGNPTCTFSTTVNLNSNSSLTFNFSNQQNPTCAGNGNDGSITATLAGGTAPYTITVDTNGTPQSSVSPIAGSLPITGLHGGTIIVTVTDAAGCTAGATATLTTPSCCSLSATSSTTQPTCGQSNGAINITPAPAGSYTYAWSDGPVTTQNRTGLAAGNYSVTITTAGNPTCTFTTSVTLNSNSTLTFNFSNQQNPTCAGGTNDGSITATLAGGTAPYTITVDTNGTPQSSVSPIAGSLPITGLHGGTINVTVTDAAGCTASASATLTTPNCCTFTISAALTQPACGQSNGGIAITASNGSGNYTYSWAPGAQTTSSINGVAAGNYLVTITDAAYANCFIDTTFALTNPNAPVIDSFKLLDASCAPGGLGGSVTVFASSPNGINVTTGYTWSNTNTDTDDTQADLAPGNYLFTVTDLAGCSTPGNVTIGVQAGCCFLQIDATVTPPSCGQNNAQITANILTAGTAPYTYSIDGTNFQSGNVFSGVAAGNYNVIAVDATQCRDTFAVVVPSSGNTLAVVVNTTNVTCFGANDGTATAVVTGGNTPVTYVWANSVNTTSALTGLAPGTFNVTVTDATNCTATASNSLIENAALVISLGNDTALCEGQTVVLSAPAGYTGYVWSDGQTTQTITPLVTGDYSVTVTSASGCTATDAVSVTLVPMPTVNLGEDKLVYEGENIGINGIVNDGTATGGNYNWLPDTLLNCATCPNVVASVYDTITYTLVYTDDYGCMGTDNITLNVLPVGDIYWPNAFTPNGDGNNDIFIPAGVGIKQIQWQMFNRWGEKVFESNNFLYGFDGTYQGKPLPMGVYVYTAKVIFMNNKDRKYKGSVTLIR